MTDISDFFAASIFPVTLPAFFGQRGFRIPCLAARKKRAPAGVLAPVPGLTDAQLADYEKYGYKCRDRLHIPGEFPMRRQNLIILNGNKIKLGDSLSTNPNAKPDSLHLHIDSYSQDYHANPDA